MSISEASTIQFHRIDESDAERLLALIWRILEEHALATPVLDVRSANGLIDVTLTFQSPGDRALALGLVGAKTEVAPSEMPAAVDTADAQQKRLKRWRQKAEEIRTVGGQFVTPAETFRNLNDLADAADCLMRAVAGILIEVKRQLGDAEA